MEGLRFYNDTCQDFDSYIIGLLMSPGSAELRFIERSMTQFRLSGTYHVQDVIADVYMRGCRFISNGSTISYPSAWVRRTALNVIRELARKERYKAEFYNESLDNESLDNVRLDQKLSYDSDQFSELESEHALRVVMTALDKLDPADQKILRSRIIDGMSWEEIAIRMGSDAAPSERNKYVDPQTLRKRGSRALERLRKVYSEIEETVKFNFDDTHSDLDITDI